MFNLKASWGALLALVGVTATAAPTLPVTEATLDDLNTRAQAQADALVSANNLVATLTTERDTHAETIQAKKTELATAGETIKAKETELATASTKVTELTAEVARLGKQPGATPTEPTKVGADESTTPPAKDAIVDPEASHNQLAAKYFS